MGGGSCHSHEGSTPLWAYCESPCKANFIEQSIPSIFRYFSIFHGNALNLVADDKILKLTRFVIISWSIAATFYEGLTKNYHHSIVLKNMTGGKNSAQPMKPLSIDYIIMANFLIITLVHISIEFYKRGNQAMKSVTPYSIYTLRFFTLLILIIGAPLLLGMNIFPTDKALKKLVFDVIFNFFVFVVIPGWAIFKNDKIVTFFKTKILCFDKDTMITLFV